MNSSAKKYFGQDFVDKIYEIFENAEQEDKFVFIHGTAMLEDAVDILRNGLECDYPEILYTSILMNKDDELLFEKLRKWPHANLKYLLIMCIPKNAGIGGIPIWDNDILAEGLYRLPIQFIKGLIFVKERVVLQNPNYNSQKDIKATIEDKSFERRTGKCLNLSLPSYEEAFNEEFFDSGEIE